MAELKKVISSKLIKNEVKMNPVKVEPSTSASTSQYFSPRRTRNQRKLVVEYEDDNAKAKKPSITQLSKFMDIDKKEPGSKTAEKKRKLYTQYDMFEANLLKDRYGDQKKNPKTEKWEPDNWKKVLENLKQMRLEKVAPVDTMGCDQCPDQLLDEKTKRFQILVALMLSSQTKDQTTYEAMSRLKENSLTPEKIVEIELEELEKLLHPVSFYKTKAKHIQKTANILIADYNSDIPNTLENLVKLPGVGPKMAHICMKSAWNIVTGIGVDVHVHRISNRLGWVRNTKDPEQTRKALESWLPSEHWSVVNHLLVGFGQTICTPLKPNCAECKNQNICPSAFNVETKSKTEKKLKFQC